MCEDVKSGKRNSGVNNEVKYSKCKLTCHEHY
jgi:hypothetical protein